MDDRGDNRGAARADLLTGAVLFALAVAIVVGSWNMDRLATRGVHPLSAPGFTPGLLGLALALTSGLLVIQALGRGGAAGGWGLRLGRPSAATLRLLAAGTLCLVYALGLVGLMPYWLATAVFVASFIAVFEWGDERPLPVRLAWAVAIGVVSGLAVSYAFRELFLVRLP